MRKRARNAVERLVTRDLDDRESFATAVDSHGRSERAVGPNPVNETPSLASLLHPKEDQRGSQMPGEYSQASLASHFEVTNRRLDRIEAQLVLISKTAGVPYATYADSLNVPDEVVALARAGKQLDAVKRYRELTGANIDQAREVIVGL